MVSSTSMNAIPSPPPPPPVSRPGTRAVRPASSPALTRSSCWTWPWVNDRRNVPSVKGARTPANNRPIPPWRSRSRSSMLSAPASIPAVLAPRFGEGTDSPPSRSSKAADSANRSMGTSPAADTRFGSSKTGRIVRDDFTYEVPLVNRWVSTSQSTSSLLTEAPRTTPRPSHPTRRWIRVQRQALLSRPEPPVSRRSLESAPPQWGQVGLTHSPVAPPTSQRIRSTAGRTTGCMEHGKEREDRCHRERGDDAAHGKRGAGSADTGEGCEEAAEQELAAPEDR